MATTTIDTSNIQLSSVLFTAAIAYVVYKLVTFVLAWRAYKNKLSRIPSVPAPSKVLGHYEILADARCHEYLHKLHSEIGPLHRMDLATLPIVWVTGPKHIKAILNARPALYSRDINLRSVMREAGHGLFDAEGEEWHRLRKLTSPAFTPVMVNGMVPSMVKHTMEMRQTWSERLKAGSGKAVFTADRDFAETAMKIFVETTFGEQMPHKVKAINGVTQEELVEDFSVVAPEVFRRLIMLLADWQVLRRQYVYRTPHERAIDDRTERCMKTAELILRECIKGFKENPKGTAAVDRDTRKGKDFADLFIRANEELLSTPAGVESFVKDFRYLLLQLIVAGFETTASSLPAILYYLAQHPKIHARVQTVCDALVDPMTGQLNADLSDPSQLSDMTQQMQYIQHVIRESMRLRPVGPVLVFEANTDVKIEGYDIPKGAFVGTVLYASDRRDEELIQLNKDKNMPSLDEFEPDRWLDEELNKKLTENFLMFGGGVRICPGRFLSMMEMQLIVTLVYGFFDLKLIDKEAVVEVRKFTNRLENVKVEITPRPQYKHLFA